MRPNVLALLFAGIVLVLVGIGWTVWAATSRAPAPNPAHALVLFGNALILTTIALTARVAAGVRFFIGLVIVASALVGGWDLLS